MLLDAITLALKLFIYGIIAVLLASFVAANFRLWRGRREDTSLAAATAGSWQGPRQDDIDAALCEDIDAALCEKDLTSRLRDLETENGMLLRHSERQSRQIKRARTSAKRWFDLAMRLRNEAQAHAQEARTQRATVHAIYQHTTGKTGEPGDWNGAGPVIAEIDHLRAANALMYKALRVVVDLADNDVICVRSRDNAAFAEAMSSCNAALDRAKD